jgi:hypothetical protein
MSVHQYVSVAVPTVYFLVLVVLLKVPKHEIFGLGVISSKNPP